ncbi:alpha/beta hydrolase family protein [Enterovibrio coralii]|uniref:Lipoprotein signal peptide n=1 Tax=Enterovibrio coralii TaxID=294935 RepID=A0A135ID87_9GAMM|nr:alpha/beta hydrolase [Enterovibrio coralii]KXF83431.1 lipoprotein signal peptide [Enterovibrio coralii]
MKQLIAVFIFVFFSINTAIGQSIGFEQIVLRDVAERPLSVSIWYPTKQKMPLTRIGENIVFVGTDVVKNAPVLTSRSPLIVLSHGYRGSWRNLNWLAHEFARLGYVVAAPDHPGTTTFDTAEEKAAQWWQRPSDLSRVITYMLEESDWRDALDDSEVSAIGHSLGGWSVLQLVGAQFNRATFKAECLRYPNPRVCGLSDELGLTAKQPNEPLSSKVFDSRVKRAVSLDLGMARSFSISSLNAIEKPVLVLAAGIDIGDLPQAQESGYIAEHLALQNRRYKVYEAATHFSFMQLCKPGAVERLNEEVPGDGIICTDGKETSREVLHKQIFSDVVRFIKSQ